MARFERLTFVDDDERKVAVDIEGLGVDIVERIDVRREWAEIDYADGTIVYIPTSDVKRIILRPAELAQLDQARTEEQENVRHPLEEGGAGSEY